jgi:Uma2 family endonuclease
MADAARHIPRMSAGEYLEIEKQATCKHEFADGIVYAMAGASRRHNDIALNIVGLLNDSLPPECRADALEVKVQVKTTEQEFFYYPDVVVTCSNLDTDDYLIKQPSLIIEVLSPSTADADRGYKFDDYKKLASLQEYVLVHQERPCVKVYRRRTDWLQEIYGLDGEITFEGAGVTLPVATFYRRVRFEAA